ncbi:peptide chain release factor N(5)-glutamine methyltransferase [Microvirga sp. STR05]|uniref:peptide chain release factor N(5)-glutamine methyltransferase n=1 Tax=Hymenobacter duratus TaxID=2771356 RepID=A0ABR8JE25_9BACT|nr:peptide chain release factor N(5)-glutamine methyltransferase [Hymenobacter duratus]MBD2713605.1 peptide chain release factor N(5)-glutamine methyltransferase [Hymenobacter duratus]MBR7948507.1 peptide chain release factor N(5)-glutamine methyltransferase [Microvirga sp. STR05]
MPTLRQLTADLSTDLQAHYPVPEAASIAGLVLEHLLELTPLQRRMQADTLVPAEVLAQLPALQARLMRHEPVQYVLGVAHFAGMELAVTPATLIPRPETEELVQLIVTEQRGQSTTLSVLDVGTGSGCIALALCRELEPARTVAVDVSGEALAVASRNAARYGCEIDFQQVDILTQEPQGIAPATLDVLVSNPPYVLESERPLMRANVLNYEPASALFVPNHDPLLFYRCIAELGTKLLRPGGALYFEINEQYATETVALLVGLGYTSAAACPDMFDKARIVRASLPGV